MQEFLKTKVIVPPLNTKVVPRYELVNKLNDNLQVGKMFCRKLTLFCAPAGYGKTTLTRIWLEKEKESTAWVSLDEHDNSPSLFWGYIITALQKFDRNLGKNILHFLNSNNYFTEWSSKSIIVPLLNELMEREGIMYLVLDDYHLITNSEIHQGMAYFIENLPPNLHLVVTTRSLPPWPLAKWRAKEKLLEVGVNQLKFTIEEISTMLKLYDNLLLKDEEIEILLTKTAGWVTGLKLAISSLLSTKDVEGFIKKFSGNHCSILHFLTEEVFNNQEKEIRDFLLETSIFQRFNSTLCDQITERSNSEKILAKLDRDNLFLIPLDEKKSWFTYHPLFSQILLSMLKKHYYEKFIHLNQRAFDYFLQSNEPSTALYHSYIINDFDKTAFVLHHFPIEQLFNLNHLQLIHKYFQNFSLDILKKYPRLILYKAFIMLILGDMKKVEYYLNLASEVNSSDEGYLGILTTIQVYYKIYAGKVCLTDVLETSKKALNLLPQGDFFWSMATTVVCGDALFFSGEFKKAHHYYLKAYSIILIIKIPISFYLPEQRSLLHYLNLEN
ncbi:hypothetical protein [Anaerobranca gottschalkii]|uniref:LuxR family transcriptional regulator, maltose regulon positive regulatory protein n=1 Tax=Anaerobranca gottschalkii DSM 13577 TaxID=1120990 RepID=A0A1H9ZNL0_9FIRM|nr:hypothetical protein [Anaerobranca gottschalkii]SES83346.1 LuxR family transcriptional regulator, maltose regulon positive regulatory protein [Anaerobranca gottschalkii DSM 13577]